MEEFVAGVCTHDTEVGLTFRVLVSRQLLRVANCKAPFPTESMERETQRSSVSSSISMKSDHQARSSGPGHGSGKLTRKAHVRLAHQARVRLNACCLTSTTQAGLE
jgi:hypothetical protein